MRGTLILLTSLAFPALGWPCSADDITSPIVGLWKLTGTTTKNVATGVMERQYGERPSGYQLFTKGGHMIFISVAENRKPPSQTVPTVAELPNRILGVEPAELLRLPPGKRRRGG
jgi:hypothetical protein